MHDIYASPESDQEYRFSHLNEAVIKPGLCSHCGSCVGLSSGKLAFELTSNGPLPASIKGADPTIPRLAFECCPGKGLNYPQLNQFVFNTLPNSWLIGCFKKIFVGHSSDPKIRLQGASGGVISQTLVYLLDRGLIDGAVVLKQGSPEPWLASPMIARTRSEILACSQSVYIPAPVNTILEEISSNEEHLAYVGLPDQVASLRQLQRLGHPGALKIRYVIGPYVGTSMYLDAILSFLRSNGIQSLKEIKKLRYRAGEWPGHLLIETISGKELKANKFYYNYLIPFFITQSTLFSVDFTNELTDISVGDAWHPTYEQQGQGFSVVIARTEQGEQLLADMKGQGLVSLEETQLEFALSMHGHMLDFKKRGGFIRLSWRKAFGGNIPDYGYRPTNIPFSRQLVEIVILGLFSICRLRISRRIIELIPLTILGPVFDSLRKGWKNLSKPTKRKGLGAITFESWFN